VTEPDEETGKDTDFQNELIGSLSTCSELG